MELTKDEEDFIKRVNRNYGYYSERAKEYVKQLEAKKFKEVEE